MVSQLTQFGPISQPDPSYEQAPTFICTSLISPFSIQFSFGISIFSYLQALLQKWEAPHIPFNSLNFTFWLLFLSGIVICRDLIKELLLLTGVVASSFPLMGLLPSSWVLAFELICSFCRNAFKYTISFQNQTFT